jgi:hypothetical protein
MDQIMIGQREADAMRNQLEELEKIGTMIGQGEPLSEVQDRWGVFVERLAAQEVPADINALVQQVLREAYLETNKDLQFYADKVRYFNDLKEQIRDSLTRARATLCESQGLAKQKLEAQIRELEDKLDSVGDDAQLANVDLQNMLQKQQQLMQMMSQISKMLHDTATSVIRKIG